ncbi:MAG: hypothetical protein U0Q16_31745 [Bryobacteraceae bacterium]
MRIIPRIFFWVVVTVAATGLAAADGLKVIAHSSVGIDEISADDLRAVFLGTRTSLKRAGPVRPVLDRDHSSLQRFSASYLGKSSSALETYYRSLMFTGKGTLPVGFPSDEEVVAYVARTPGTIGFVRQSTPAAQVKTLRVTGAP